MESNQRSRLTFESWYQVGCQNISSCLCGLFYPPRSIHFGQNKAHSRCFREKRNFHLTENRVRLSFLRRWHLRGTEMTRKGQNCRSLDSRTFKLWGSSWKRVNLNCEDTFFWVSKSHSGHHTRWADNQRKPAITADFHSLVKGPFFSSTCSLWICFTRHWVFSVNLRQNEALFQIETDCVWCRTVQCLCWDNNFYLKVQSPDRRCISRYEASFSPCYPAWSSLVSIVISWKWDDNSFIQLDHKSSDSSFQRTQG